MRKALVLLLLLIFSTKIFAQNEIGPDGDKLIIIIIFIVILLLVFWFLNRSGKKGKNNTNKPFFQFKKVHIELEKDRLYYPDVLTLSVKNTGNVDLDLDKPLLVFDNFWLKRKFKIKGMENRTFYPLYLEKGKTHVLEIDINRFSFHYKRFKKFPNSTLYISDVQGKRSWSKSIFLRKTLFKF